MKETGGVMASLRIAGVALVVGLGWLGALLLEKGVPASTGRGGVKPAVPGACEVPGEPDSSLYSRLAEEELPWSAAPPERLTRLRRETGATHLLAGFRTTLPDPILEERYNISLAARQLAGTVVPPGGVFSMNGTLGPYTRRRGYRDGPSYVGNQIVPSEGGGVCKISSTLYNVVVFANLRVLERHPHGMTVPYVPAGRDATVSYGSYDFRFQNTTGHPVVIWAATGDDSLYMAIYGAVAPPRVAWEQEVLSRRPTWEVRRPNPQLPPGTERVLVKGAEGITVRTWIRVEHPGGVVERRNAGTDVYQPMPRVVEYGPEPQP